jgi:hypothetical protein
MESVVWLVYLCVCRFGAGRRERVRPTRQGGWKVFPQFVAETFDHREDASFGLRSAPGIGQVARQVIACIILKGL